MQSKLPIRNKKKIEEQKCCCNKFFELIIQNPNDSYCTFCTSKGKNVLETSLEDFKNSVTQLMYSRWTQTETSTETEKKSLSDIKTILIKINSNLEAILETLQDRKELLYNKLQEECPPCKKNKMFHNKNKIDKIKKKNVQLIRKFSYGGWPDISRLYYGQPSWLKNYMQKIAAGLAQHESSLVITPKSHSWIYTARPNSCPNINYFQPMGNLLGKRQPIEIPIRSAPAFAMGQGDLIGGRRGKGDDPDEIHEDMD